MNNTNKPDEGKLMDLLNKLKKRPFFDEHVELGKMLMRPIESLTPEERKRYDELTKILTKANNHE